MRRDPFELQPGQLVDRYQLLLPVATGGTSQIWAARRCGTRGFEKLVALKTLAVPDSESRELERLLWREGRLASRIQHANVVQHFDLIEQDGVLCLVMEWIDGESLSSLLRRVSRAGGLPLGIAVQILVQACRGLQAAHELRGADGQPLGLAHCDVSPQNLMIDGSGVVKLIDFGIAKVRRFDGGGDDRVRGKPSFMAPEQAMRQHVDLRADIFSLGIMGYLLTTGHHPFGARNATDTLLAICSDVPVARRARSSKVIRGLCSVSCCARSRDSLRYATNLRPRCSRIWWRHFPAMHRNPSWLGFCTAPAAALSIAAAR